MSDEVAEHLLKVKNTLLALFHENAMVHKSYIREKVRMAFASPEPSTLLDSNNKQVYDELMEKGQ